MGAKIIFQIKEYTKEKIADIYFKSQSNLKSINLPKNFNNSSAIDEFVSIFIIAAFFKRHKQYLKGLTELNKKESRRLDWGYKNIKNDWNKSKKNFHGLKIYGNPKLELNGKYIINKLFKDHRIAMNTIILALAKGQDGNS